MYLPPNIVELKNQTTQAQIRLGIQGAPKTGKTFAATTFPNPIFLNFDRGLGAHQGKSGIFEIPIWDIEYLKKSNKKPHERTEFLVSWLSTEGQKLQEDQTLILDGSTGIQNAFNMWSEANPQYNKSGKIDDFAHWNLKIEYFASLCEFLKTLKCHVIYIAHETLDRNKDGELNGKVRPMLTGQFGDQLASHFTDWTRQHAIEKPKDYNSIKPETLANFRMTASEFKEMCLSFKDTSSVYFWQTSPDSVCNCGSSTLVNPPLYIPSRYQDFIKYTNKN